MARSYWLFGAHFTIHANHEDTAGRYDLVEGGGPPGYQTPLHRHTRYAEQFYVRKGSSRSGPASGRPCRTPATSSPFPPARRTPWP